MGRHAPWGYPVRVTSIVQGLAVVAPTAAQGGDIWAIHVGERHEHAGIVSSVTPGLPGTRPVIGIDNDSSGQGGVRTNDWGRHFHNAGNFYRWP